MPICRSVAALLALFLLAASAARAEEEALPADFDAYQEEMEIKCVGPVDGRLAKTQVYELNGFRYELEGARAKVTRTKERTKPVSLGILSAIKDDAPETQANLADYLAKFAAADVDGIVVGGDTAFDESEIVAIITHVAKAGVPVYAIIGNQENRSSWNRACRELHRKYPNVINLDLVRVLEAEAFDLVSLPGYFDKRYTHQSGSCVYTAADAKGLVKLAAPLDGPVVLVSHGPPKQAGKSALDWVPNAGNVGDEHMAKAIAEAKIPFGIFGHVLEAGGRGTDLSGRREVKPNTWSDTLYLNAGSANSLPWRMNTGPASYGMAMLLTFDGKKARYEVYRSPQREPTPEATIGQ